MALQMTETLGGGRITSTPSPLGQFASNSGSTRTSAAGAGSAGGSYADILRAIQNENNAFNVAQTEMVNAFNAHEAAKNRQWQQWMAEHAHQIEVEDLKKAGLNPVLSALNGNGASVGSGATASGQKAVADNTLGNGLISMMSAMLNASSAATVASIYANASMYAANKNYGAALYGADVNSANNYRSTAQSDVNSQRSSITQLLQGLLGTLGSVMAGQYYRKSRHS